LRRDPEYRAVESKPASAGVLALEVIALMLDEYDVVRDADFARTKIIPFADAIVTYYDVHWPHAADEKLRLAPVQSLEAYQVEAVAKSGESEAAISAGAGIGEEVIFEA
jgi:hypothetical protein